MGGLLVDIPLAVGKRPLAKKAETAIAETFQAWFWSQMTRLAKTDQTFADLRSRRLSSIGGARWP